MGIRPLAEEGYRTLLSRILYQTIVDYTTAKKREHKLGIVDGVAAMRLASCKQFFSDCPYDYGDIDLQKVQMLCDERAIDGKPYFVDARML